MLVFEIELHGLVDRSFAGVADPQHLGDLRQHEVGITDRGKFDEDNPVRKLGSCPCGDRPCQCRFPSAADADKCDKPDRVGAEELFDLGYLLFAPAFVLGNLYIGQSWRLKTKQLSSAKLPPLVTLETSAWRLLTVGFVLYTLGIDGGYLSSESAHQSVRPQHVVAGLAWLVYATALVRRYASGWRGVRAAVALLAGFVITSGAVLLYVLR